MYQSMGNFNGQNTNVNIKKPIIVPNQFVSVIEPVNETPNNNENKNEDSNKLKNDYHKAALYLARLHEEYKIKKNELDLLKISITSPSISSKYL
jgi:hypothetical protein